MGGGGDVLRGSGRVEGKQVQTQSRPQFIFPSIGDGPRFQIS